MTDKLLTIYGYVLGALCALVAVPALYQAITEGGWWVSFIGIFAALFSYLLISDAHGKRSRTSNPR